MDKKRRSSLSLSLRDRSVIMHGKATTIGVVAALASQHREAEAVVVATEEVAAAARASAEGGEETEVVNEAVGVIAGTRVLMQTLAQGMVEEAWSTRNVRCTPPAEEF